MVNFILKKTQPYMLLLDEHQEIQLQVIMVDGMAAEMVMAHMRVLMVRQDLVAVLLMYDCQVLAQVLQTGRLVSRAVSL